MRSTLLVMIVALVAGSAAAAELVSPEVSVLRLRRTAVATGPTVTLGDVLDLRKADPVLVEALADQPVFAEQPTGGHCDVSYELVRERLYALGVNMSRVIIRGALSCDVELRAKEERPETRPASGAPLLRPGAASDSGPATLAATVTHYLEEELAEYGGRLEVEFNRGSEPYIDLTTPPYDFRVRRVGPAELGTRELRVTISRDGRVHRTVSLFAKVRLIKEVVVARGPLNPGQVVRPEEISLEERVFERLADIGVDSVSLAVGQQVGRLVKAGEMVAPDDLRDTPLVQRSRPVNVIGDRGGISIQVTGKALDTGHYGETVRVRLGNPHEGHREVRGVVTALSTVKLVD